MVLHQHEAAQFWSESGLFDPVWQWGQYRAAIGRDPAFALVTGRLHRNHQVLHQKRIEYPLKRKEPGGISAMITFSSMPTRGA